MIHLFKATISFSDKELSEAEIGIYADDANEAFFKAFRFLTERQAKALEHVTIELLWTEEE